MSWQLTITARQYGEVVLPDTASEHDPGTPPQAGPHNCHGARKVWRGFCRPGTSFVSYTSVAVQCRLGAGNKSRYTELDCGHWRDRGTIYYKSVKGAGVKAKTMTNDLPILSVLCVRAVYFLV